MTRHRTGQPPLPSAAADPALPWWPTRLPARPSGTDPLSAERVLEAALALIAADGLDALTMRRLAARLGVSAPAIYWWAGSKDQLLAQVADAVMGRIVLPEPWEGGWRDQVRLLAERSYAVLHRYRALLPVFTAGVASGPNTVRVLERWMAILLGAGFDPDRAVRVHGAILAQILGCVPRDPDVQAARDRRWTGGHALEDLPPDRYPALGRAARALRQAKPEERFQFGLDLLMRGLDGLLA
jgi:AcrR family transcriptional regulator